MAEFPMKKDVPDTLWIGGVARNNVYIKDKAAFRTAFQEWCRFYEAVSAIKFTDKFVKYRIKDKNFFSNCR
jgi:hypothetical protein